MPRLSPDTAALFVHPRSEPLQPTALLERWRGLFGGAAGSYQGISAYPISECVFSRAFRRELIRWIRRQAALIARLRRNSSIPCAGPSHMTGHAVSQRRGGNYAGRTPHRSATSMISIILVAGLDLVCLVPRFRRLCQSGWAVANYFRNDHEPLRIHEYYHTPLCSNHRSRLELSSQLQKLWNFTPPGRAWCTQDRRICFPPGSGQGPPLFRNPQSGFAGVFRCKRCRAIEKSRRQDLFFFSKNLN